MFSIAKLFITALAVTSVAVADIAPVHVAGELKRLTQMALELKSPGLSITVINAPLFVAGQGPYPVIISGIDKQTTIASDLTSHFNGPITGSGQARDDYIFDAFNQFVKVEEEFLNILIGKSGILHNVESSTIGHSVATTLRQFKTPVDTIVVYLTKQVASRATELTELAIHMDNTLVLAIKKYDELKV